jgi:hypothetical protein
MIKFKITRDQARMIQEQWFPYMVAAAASQLANNAGNDAKYLNAVILESLLLEVRKMFRGKLFNAEDKPGNPNFTFNLKRSQAPAFYVSIMQLGIDVQNVYAFAFRQQLCDVLHQQLFANRPPAHESVPLSINDYL